MSEFTYPLDGTQNYTAKQAAAWMGTRTSGVFSADDNFKPTVSGTRNVVISAGRAWITTEKYYGKVYVNDTATTFTMGAPNATLNTYYRFVVRWRKTENTITLMMLTGTPASKPTPPTIQQTDDIYDLVICDYYQKAGEATVDVSNLTDRRLDEKLCGIMKDAVTGIPTSALNAQVEALIDELQTQITQTASGATPDNSITTAKLVNKAVTVAKMAITPFEVYNSLGAWQTATGKTVGDKTLAQILDDFDGIMGNYPAVSQPAMITDTVCADAVIVVFPFSPASTKKTGLILKYAGNRIYKFTYDGTEVKYFQITSTAI